MKKFLKKNKKYLSWLLLFAVVLSFVILPAIALAQATGGAPASDSGWVGQLIGWISGKALLFLSSLISLVISTFFGVIIGIEAKIIDYILSPTNFSLTAAPIVTLGWGITRDLANMFFILILLIIAFATVLRIKSYAIQQLWWKVVVAALLINFSLVIAGFVIDFTQVLTQFFLKQIAGGGIGTMTTKLAASMQILNFYNPATPTSVLEGVAQLGASSIAAFVGFLLTLIGLVITTFVFGAAMIFLIVRILHLWLLLILAPIVWMLWILPATSGYFSQWWNAFIKWAFFAPIFVFMIYLSLSIFDANGKLNPKVFGVMSVPGWHTPAPGLTTVGMPAAIFQWILVIAMMFGSLIVAQKFGVYGAAASQKMLTGWGDRAKGWARGQVRQRFTQWTQPTPPPAPGGPAPGAFRRFGAAVGNIASATPWLRGKYLATQAAEEQAYQAEYNKVRNVNPAVVDNMLKNGVFVNQRQRVALAQSLAERNWLNTAHGYSVAQRQAIVQQANNMGRANTFLAMDPQFATVVPGRTVDGEVRRIRPENVHSLSREAATDPGVVNSMVNNFSGAHIQGAANAGRGDVLSGVETNIRAMGADRAARIAALRATNPRLALWLSRSPGNTLINLN